MFRRAPSAHGDVAAKLADISVRHGLGPRGREGGVAGRGKPDTHESSTKGGKKGGEASASRSAAERSASAKKAAATRKRNAQSHAHH